MKRITICTIILSEEIGEAQVRLIYLQIEKSTTGLCKNEDTSS